MNGKPVNPPNLKPITSLTEVRGLRAKLARKPYLDTETRLKELEADMLRVIDLSLSLEHTVYQQEKLLSKLIRLLAEKAGVSTSQE